MSLPLGIFLASESEFASFPSAFKLWNQLLSMGIIHSFSAQ